MVTGPSLGNLLPVAMVVVGLVTMLRARARRKSGKVVADEDFEARRAATLETERRMASYLAGRGSLGSYRAPSDEDDEASRN